MRLVLMLFLLAISLRLSRARVQPSAYIVSSSTVRATDQSEIAQSRKPLDNVKHIKRLRIRNQTGLDGKVRRIRLESDEDKPGIRAYGLPKTRLEDNGVIERVNVEEGRIINNDSRNSRLVEAYGMPKDHVEDNGFIERLSFATTDRQTIRLQSEQNEKIRARRSVREGSENKIYEKIASEAEDMVAQDSKVFRPLFVYRQQVAARESRKHARNLAHRNHRHAIHHFCDHRRAIY